MCFKQKTAYEMRISDWSSDVCSSDLIRQRRITTEIAVVDRHEQAILQPCRHAASLRPGMPVHVDELGVGTPLPQPAQLHRPQRRLDRKRGVYVNRVSRRVDLGGRRII